MRIPVLNGSPGRENSDTTRVTCANPDGAKVAAPLKAIPDRMPPLSGTAARKAAEDRS